MRAVRIVVVGLLIIVLAGVAVGATALAWVTARAWPQTSGQLEVAGLHDAVTVRRDVHGLVDIRAHDAHDLFLAQGYVHAQERMWQMEVWRHISSGRLAELFGEGSLDTDKFIRAIGWQRAAERDLAAASADVRATLDAYAAGVNAWLDAHRGSLGLAFVITGDDPEPWSPLDTMTWAKVQAWNLGGNMASELFRYLADARLGDPAMTDELFLPREGGPVIVPSDEPFAATSARPGPRAAHLRDQGGGIALAPDVAAGWLHVAASARAALDVAGLAAGGGLLASGDGIGSNDWVVTPELSASGGALLANDPHLGISMPSIWFINGLHCETVGPDCPYDVTGVSFPGAPGVILGHNARIAWGATNANPDVQDLVIETPDPADPSGKVIGPDGSPAPVDVRTEVIKVKGGQPVTLRVRETSHGPILNDVEPRLKDAPLMAVRWTGTDAAAAPDRTVEAFLRLDAAGTWDEFREALALYGAPGQNFVYADVDGRVGYQLAGYVPVRSDPTDRSARPVRGDDGSGEWVGRIAFADLPSRTEAADGWIVTANNAIVDEGYPAFLGQEWDPGYRAERIIDDLNLAAEDGVTLEEMGRIQMDTAPLRARDIVERLPEVQPSTEDGRTIADRIETWNGDCEVDSLGCAAYMTWEYHVLRAILDDDLGLDLAREYVGGALSWPMLTRLLEDPSSPWWDDRSTPDVETDEEVITAAMDAAGADLRAAYGAPDRWSWGRLHTATFKEGTIGANSGIGPLEWYFNEGPIAVAGAAGAPDATSYRFKRAYPDPTDPDYAPVGIAGLFDVTNLPSYRLLIDLSDLDGARIVITTGQSGNPFDRHVNDLIDPWRLGETVPLPFTRAAVEAAATTTLELTP